MGRRDRLANAKQSEFRKSKEAFSFHSSPLGRSRFLGLYNEKREIAARFQISPPNSVSTRWLQQDLQSRIRG